MYIVQVQEQVQEQEQGQVQEQVQEHVQVQVARYKNKGSLDWWMNLPPSTGRPLSTAMAPQDGSLNKPALLCGGILD